MYQMKTAKLVSSKKWEGKLSSVIYIVFIFNYPVYSPKKNHGPKEVRNSYVR